MTINEFIKKRPYLVWYVKNYKKLSDESVIEHTLNYGNWEDVQKLFSIFGVKKQRRFFANKQADGEVITTRK